MSTNSSSPKSFISIGMLCSAFENSARRFPVTVIYIALFTLWCIIEICDPHHSITDLESGIWYLTSVGMPLTLAVYIWCEYLGRKCTIPQVVANILLLVDSIYIICCGFNYDSQWGLSRMALMTALVVAILFVPIKKSWAWNYTVSLLRAIVISYAYVLVAGFAVGIIFLTIYALFDVSNIDKAMLSCMVLLSFTLPAVIFLHLIPRKEEVEEKERNFHASKLESGSAKYFLFPLTVIYMAILYIYAIDILCSWELPRGGVCWSVTGLTAAVFITNFFLEGVRRTSPDDSLARFSLRYLPVALLPLLVLMSIAVIYRINQYGLTLSRLYVLTFNLWSYAVIIYYMICRPKTINLIALSFAIIFVATSILPFANYKTLTDSIMHERLVNTLKSEGFGTLPLSKTDFLNTYRSLPDSTQSDVESMMLYLDSYKDHSQLDDIIKYDAENDLSIRSLFWDHSFDFDSNINIELSNDDDKSIAIPEGFTRTTSVTVYYKSLKADEAGVTLTIDGVKYAVPVDSLMKMKSTDHFGGIAFYPVSGSTDSLYITKDIDISADTENPVKNSDFTRFHSSGMLFTK